MGIIILGFFSLVAAYFVWFFLDESRKQKYSPPGPPSLPFIGSVIHLARAHSQAHLALVKLAEKYGDVMRVKLGTHEYVVLSSMEALNDLLTRDESLGRPDHGVLRDRAEVPNTGIILATGESWKIKRSWMTRTLREMRIGRTSYFEEATREMVKEFHSNFSSDISPSGKVVTVDRKLALCSGTMMWRLLVGSQTPQDDADCEAFILANQKYIENGAFGDGLLLIAPFLKYFVPRATGYAAQMECIKVGKEIAQKWYNTLKNKASDSRQSFFHSYLQEENNRQPGFSEDDFKMTFTDMLTGSVETNNPFLQSLLLFLTCYPEIQQTLYEEITKNFPYDHTFTIADLKQMPYTQSFMLETHRIVIIATNWVPRTLTGDVKYRGFTLKKGTTLLPNPHSAFKSRTHFGPDPDAFRPERFLDPNDPTKMNTLKNFVTPFSIGKRSCPGESIAQLLAFITLVSTVKYFKLSTVPGETPPSQEFFIGILARPQPFRALVQRR